jgi:hypothetical protein
MTVPKRGLGRPERFRAPDGWAPLRVAISPEANALDLVLVWRCLRHAGRHIEAQEVFDRLQALAERAPPGKVFKVRHR